MYSFGFILVLAVAAGVESLDAGPYLATTPRIWSLYSPPQPPIPTAPVYVATEEPTEVPEWTSPKVDPVTWFKEKVVVGYQPIFKDLLWNATEAPDYEAQLVGYKCAKRYAYYRNKGSCDTYIECRNFVSSLKVCPDGMHFKDNPRWSEYPCAYFPEAKCLVRGGALPSRPTAECPHQFGNYPLTTELRYSTLDRCRSYISCSSGVAHVMNCTFGLVFNPKLKLCDWPERVAGCQDNFEFRCPVPHLGEEDMVVNYRYPDPECRFFYSCLNGGYRVLACDEGLLFDYRIGRCVEYDDFVCDYELH